MKEDIRVSIDAKIDHIRNFFEVTPSVGDELIELKKEMEELANTADNSMDFETKLASSAVGQRYYALFSKLTPKAADATQSTAQMTADAYKKMFERSDKKELAKEAIKEAVDMAAVEAKEEAISLRRKAMIEAGVFDEYTRATNKVEDAGRAIGVLGKLLKK